MARVASNPRSTRGKVKPKPKPLAKTPIEPCEQVEPEPEQPEEEPEPEPEEPGELPAEKPEDMETVVPPPPAELALERLRDTVDTLYPKGSGCPNCLKEFTPSSTGEIVCTCDPLGIRNVLESILEQLATMIRMTETTQSGGSDAAAN